MGLITLDCVGGPLDGGKLHIEEGQHAKTIHVVGTGRRYRYIRRRVGFFTPERTLYERLVLLSAEVWEKIGDDA